MNQQPPSSFSIKKVKYDKECKNLQLHDSSRIDGHTFNGVSNDFQSWSVNKDRQALYFAIGHVDNNNKKMVVEHHEESADSIICSPGLGDFMAMTGSRLQEHFKFNANKLRADIGHHDEILPMTKMLY